MGLFWGERGSVNRAANANAKPDGKGVERLDMTSSIIASAVTRRGFLLSLRCPRLSMADSLSYLLPILLLAYIGFSKNNGTLKKIVVEGY